MHPVFSKYFLGVSRQVSARAWGRVHVNRNFDRIKSFPHFSSDCLNCSLKTRLEKEVRSQNWVGYVTVHLIKLKFTVTDRDRLLTRKKGYASFLASGCREFKTIMPVLWHFHLSVDKKNHSSHNNESEQGFKTSSLTNVNQESINWWSSHVWTESEPAWSAGKRNWLDLDWF